MRTQEKHATRFRSIQTSLLFVIVPAVIISMAVLSLMGYLSSKAIIQTSAGNEMSQCLSVAMGSIEMSLSNNRMVAETMARGVEAVQRQAVKGEQTASDWDAAAYQEILTSFVGSNPETFGGGIWFEPYQYRPEQRYFSPYCMRQNGAVTYVDNYSLGEGVYYTDQDWYTNAANTTQKSVWSAPYYDEFAQISMVTSSAPIYDETGRFLGVATADIDLTQMQQMVLSLDVVANGRAFLIDDTGVYIADEDSEKLLSANILEDDNPSFAALGRQILSQQEGSGSYTADGQTSGLVPPDPGQRLVYRHHSLGAGADGGRPYAWHHAFHPVRGICRPSVFHPSGLSPAEHRPAPPHPPGYHTENRGRKPVCGDPAQFQI